MLMADTHPTTSLMTQAPPGVHVVEWRCCNPQGRCTKGVAGRKPQLLSRLDMHCRFAEDKCERCGTMNYWIDGKPQGC